MKKPALVVLVTFIALEVFGQNSNVNKANTYISDGRLAEARELIDEAAVHEKTKDKGRTWYVRGLVYAAIASSSDTEIRDIDPNAAIVAHESFEKVKVIEREGCNYSFKCGALRKSDN